MSEKDVAIENDFTTQKVKPSDFDTKNHFFDSQFQNCEKETVARNIILLSKWNNDIWLEFTWEDYQKKCEHQVTFEEKNILNYFVREGLLQCENGIYKILDAFIVKLSDFIIKEDN